MHHLDQVFAFESRSRNQRQRLRQRIHLQRKDHVHGQLDGLPRAIRAQMKPALTQHAENWLDRFQRRGFAAHHKNQLALFRTPIATGHRGVQKMHFVFGAGRRDFAR